MSVIRFYIQGNDCNIEEKKNINLLQDSKVRELIQKCVYKNITAKEVYNKAKQRLETVGDSTECALFNYLKSNMYDIKKENNRAYYLPFNSDNKFMISIYKNEQGTGYTLYIKGAPDILESYCTKFLTAGSKIVDYSDDLKRQCKKVYDDYTNRAMRAILFAHKELSQQDISNAKKNHQEEDIEFYKELAKNSTFVLMVGIRDQIRDGVPEAIVKCNKAGINVRMVTGDSFETALAIAKEVNILKEDQIEACRRNNAEIKKMIENESEDEVAKFMGVMSKKNDVFALEGEVFRKICGNLEKHYETEDGKEVLKIKLKNISMFREVVKHLKVVARSSPEDKYLLVLGLEKLNNVVGI